MDKQVLCVGLVCVDNVYEVKSFIEDTDQSCLDRRRQRGGNASNICTILGVLGAKPSYFGTIANSIERRFIEEDFKDFGVEANLAVIVENAECPTSCVINSIATGSRTIIHYNKHLRELHLDDLCCRDVDQFPWIHFEGRSKNVEEIKKMIKYLRERNEKNGGTSSTTISIELEKPNPQLNDLVSLGDFVFVSKEYAQFRGWHSIREVLDNLSTVKRKGATVICPWSDQGAGAISGPENEIYMSPIYPPEKILDSLGAGDTFIGSTIFALSAGESVEKSIHFGCRLAGYKIGFRGWSQFREKVHHLDEFKKIIKKS